MKKINDILRNCVVTEVVGDNDRCVSALTFDSRKCADNVAFFALRGTQVDGHDFIDKAVGLGAKVVVCEKTPDVIYDDVTYYVVEDSAKALGYAASEFYDRPSEKLHLVGVTGFVKPTRAEKAPIQNISAVLSFLFNFLFPLIKFQ